MSEDLNEFYPLRTQLAKSTVSGICSLLNSCLEQNSFRLCVLHLRLQNRDHTCGHCNREVTVIPGKKNQYFILWYTYLDDYLLVISISTFFFLKATILSDNTYQASRKKLKESPLFWSHKVMQTREGTSNLFQSGFLKLSKFLFWQRWIWLTIERRFFESCC